MRKERRRIRREGERGEGRNQEKGSEVEAVRRRDGDDRRRVGRGKTRRNKREERRGKEVKWNLDARELLDALKEFASIDFVHKVIPRLILLREEGIRKLHTHSLANIIHEVQ